MSVSRPGPSGSSVYTETTASETPVTFPYVPEGAWTVQVQTGAEFRKRERRFGLTSEQLKPAEAK